MNLLSSQNGTILIVDDEPSFTKAMKRDLFDDDFEILSATTGQEALALLKEEAVDVIISDLKMPCMGGLEFIAAAKQILGYATQYIVMTGWGELETAVDAMQLGVGNYLTKPLDSDTLRTSINAALENAKAIRKSQQDDNEESEKNALILATVQAGVMLVESDSFTIASVNNAAADILETEKSLLLDTTVQQVFCKDNNEATELLAHQTLKNAELALTSKSGKHLSVQMTTAQICLNEKNYLLLSFMDISSQKKLQIDLKASQETFSAIVEQSLDGTIILSSSNEILYINHSATVFFARSRDELLGQPFPFPVVTDKPTELPFPQDGQPTKIAEMCVAKTQWHNEAAFVATLRDITQRKQLEESIRHMATHDVLTGLPNRSLLATQLEKAINLAQRNQRMVALLFVDLDNFKPINDTFGHSVGDVVLQETAKRLTDGVRASDFIARVGGDEFLVVLQEVADVEATALTTQRIIDLINIPIEVDGHNCQLGASIGISLFPDCAGTTEELIQQADAAMYHIKKKAKNSYCFYASGMELGPEGNK